MDMTEAQKKAKELVNQFYIYCNNSHVRDSYAIQCAIISQQREVDLLKLLNEKFETLDNMNLTVFSIVDYELEFSKEVLTELKKM